MGEEKLSPANTGGLWGQLRALSPFSSGASRGAGPARSRKPRQEIKQELKQLRRDLRAAERSNEDYEREQRVAEKMFQRLLAECGAMPLPPPELRIHVGRVTFPGNFLRQGSDSSSRVMEVFGEDPGGPVLDWGCGTGRTLTWLRRLEAWRANYHGCDVDPQAIAWLKSQGVERVEVCQDLPPLPYPDNSFVGLFCFSVLTHIPPKDHAAWYAEIHRVLKPGGRAYITVHSDKNMVEGKSFTDEEREAYFREGSSWSEREGHYKHAATVTRAFTESAVPPGLQIEQYRPAGYHNMDDLILRKR